MNKISVIIPCFNASKTLDRCLKSILCQTYSNIEVIIINDASTDNSLEIIKNYALLDKRLTYFNNEKGGVSKARNKGLEIAKGDYIQFIDSDDYIEPKMFETMLAKMLEHNADVVVCNYEHPCIKNYLGDCVLDLTNKCDMIKYMQSTFAFVVPWNKLYKKSVLTNAYKEGIHFTEDDLFSMSNIFNAKKLVSISDKLYNYYVAPPSSNPDEMSCINKMAHDPNFHTNQNTYWYKRTELLEITKDIFSEFMPKSAIDEFAYIRIFDFMIWEFVILQSIGIDRKKLAKQLLNIFSDARFVKSMEIKEINYGIHYHNYKDEKLNQMVKFFADTCFYCLDKTKNDKTIKPFDLVLAIFTAIFISQKGSLKTYDIVANCKHKLIANLGKECHIVNQLKIPMRYA